jgi:hypothetical protein
MSPFVIQRIFQLASPFPYTNQASLVRPEHQNPGRALGRSRTGATTAKSTEFGLLISRHSVLIKLQRGDIFRSHHRSHLPPWASNAYSCMVLGMSVGKQGLEW